MENTEIVPTDGPFKGMTAERASKYISHNAMVAQYCDDYTQYLKEQSYVDYLTRQYKLTYEASK